MPLSERKAQIQKWRAERLHYLNPENRKKIATSIKRDVKNGDRSEKFNVSRIRKILEEAKDS